MPNYCLWQIFGYCKAVFGLSTVVFQCQGLNAFFFSSHFLLLPSVIETEEEDEIEERSEEVPKSLTEASAPPSGPSGLVIFGQLVQKHSYVSALIIMMV